jgi:hypothetical protein
MLLDADPLDLPVQINTGIFLHTRTHRLAERFDIVTGRIAGIDEEIAVHFRDLRAADAEAAQPAASTSFQAL